MLTEKSTLNNNRVKLNNQKFPIMLQVLSAVYRILCYYMYIMHIKIHERNIVN